ncbi:MAG TPA: hypothetical protein VJV04_03295 [Nitrospiraceae bacterium]|nr:hypothetical protein [Nitrospiraceae bacterium]
MLDDALKPAPIETEGSDGKSHLHVSPLRQPLLIVVIAGIAMGILMRVRYVWTADFPLNDGALFYLMTQELMEAHFHLPLFTSYNFAAIPFAYPPFGLYAAALLATFTPFSLIDIVRFLPLAIDILAISAFALLARSILVEPHRVAVAVFAFALLPRGFLWFIMGGGLTRSFGLLFSLLALHQGYRLYTKGSMGAFVLTALFAALTALSHLGIVPFLAIGLTLMWFFYGWNKSGFIRSVGLAIAVLILTSPWWGTVVARHGIETFLAAKATGGSAFSNSETMRTVLTSLAYLAVGGGWGGTTGEVLFPIFGALALLGALSCLTRRQLFFPVWWLLTLVVDARSGIEYASVPAAMLSAIGLADVLFPLLNGATFGIRRPLGRNAHRRSRIGPFFQQLRFSTVLLVFLLVYAGLPIFLLRPGLGSDLRVLVGLTPDERGAMEWVADTTPQGSTFLVIPQDRWGVDRYSEWFPVLARRVSVATVQGYEWVPNKAFAKRRALFMELERCVNADAACLDEWAKKGSVHFSYVYIPQASSVQNPSCCPALVTSLMHDLRYRLVYSGPGAKIFERRDG